jgi:pilus assembly protein Flp/PilA
VTAGGFGRLTAFDVLDGRARLRTAVRRGGQQAAGELKRRYHRRSRDGATEAPHNSRTELTMFVFLNYLTTMGRDARGVTALEYGLIAGLVAAVIVTSVTSLGTTLNSTFNTIVAALP